MFLPKIELDLFKIDHLIAVSYQKGGHILPFGYLHVYTGKFSVEHFKNSTVNFIPVSQA